MDTQILYSAARPRPLELDFIGDLACPWSFIGKRNLARALGSHPAVLMTHHGATVVGGNARELVSRSIFICQNAQFQLQAHLLGKVVPLSRGETRLAGSINSMPNVTGRTWEYWTMRLEEAGRTPPKLDVADVTRTA